MTSPGAGRHVLLVDDAVEVRMLLRFLLEEDGYLVSEAADGPAGLAAATTGRPDLVVLDVQLPGLDGPDVLRALQDQPATAALPVVFLTATADDEALLGLGARGVLRKPFAPDVTRQLAALL